MTLCYLGLGSNLDNPRIQLNRALCAISKIPRTYLLRKSSVYISKPCGPISQPFFYNMVISISTSLSPEKLLAYCQRIEKQQGRIKKVKWGARTLDIDILMCEQLHIKSARLTLPHPFLHYRDFVLIPLQEIAPKLILPGMHSFAKVLAECIPYVIKKHRLF
jgi:2-amino-4-hydroxy-6-hydroxymethyldihydropteridine diphosphokinase